MEKNTKLSRLKIRWLNTRVLVLMLLGVLFSVFQGQAQIYTYTGSAQTVSLPAGSYEIEAWGADGGNTTGTNSNAGVAKLGGKGGYARGILTLTTPTTLSIYVGGKGNTEGLNVPGGFNGGGNSGDGTSTSGVCGSGGGASDVRVGGNALTDRVIVAGGGGGAGYQECNGAANVISGGHGGGLTGGTPIVGSYANRLGQGGTQTAGGAGGTEINYGATPGAGSFGLGGNGGTATSTSGNGAGGGGGWYGGGAGSHGYYCAGGGGGGSSYIGGVTTGVTMMYGDPGFLPNPDATGNGTVVITSMAPCTGTPTAGTASIIPRNCPSEPFTLSVSGATKQGGITYQWQRSDAGANNFSDINGATTATYIVTNQTVASDYRFVVTCTYSNSTDISNIVTEIGGVVTANFYESFDVVATGSTTNPTVPECWTYIRNSTVTTLYGYTTAAAGQTGQGFYTYRSAAGDGDLYLISPETDNLGNGTKQLRFSARVSSATYETTQKFEIYTMDGNTATANKTLIQGNIPLEVGWQEFIVALPATTDDFFMFSFERDGGLTYVYLDDVYYEDLLPCMFPSNIQVSNITGTTADISWVPSTAPGVTGYEYEVRDSSGTVVTSGIATSPAIGNAPVQGLTGATTYTVYVRSVCGTTTGPWTTFPAKFNTLCPVFTANFFEGFEDYSTGGTTNQNAPLCWTNLNTAFSTSVYGYISGTPNTGLRSFYMYRTLLSSGPGDLMLISPETDNLGIGTKQIRFSVRSSSTSYTPQLSIYTMDDNTATANKTLVQSIPLTSTAYTEYIVPLPVTSDDYFAFSLEHTSPTHYPAIYLDDIYYEDLSPCVFPVGLDATNITTTGATISWNPSMAINLSGYEYEVRTSGDAGSGSTGLVLSGTVGAYVNNVNLTGLDHSTSYTVYIRSICGTTEGDWTLYPLTFNTLCGIITGSFFEGFENTDTGGTTNNTVPNCWTYLKTGSNATYPYGYTSTSYPKTGSKHFYTYQGATYDDEVTLVSPETDNLGNGTKRLRFSARLLNTGDGQKLSIYSMDDNTATANKTLLQTIDVPSTAYQEFIVYFPANTTDDYFAFSFDNESMTKYIYIVDIYYEDAPPCKPIEDYAIQISNADKTGFTVNWQDLYNTTQVAYEVEVRESGAPGSAGAAFMTTTAVGVTSAVVTGLNPSTKYTVYVRAKCSPLETSDWNKGVDASTLCDYPNFVSYTQSLVLCGPQKAQLSAVLSDSLASAFWYDAPTDGEPLFEGLDFISDEIVTQDRSFWLRSGAISPNVDVQAGDGTEIDAGNWTFLYSLYHAYKHQYIFTADELAEYGLAAGPISALKFDIVSVGNYNPRLDFSISLGTTTATVGTTTMVDNNTLTEVYNNSAQPLNTGIMTFTFTTPYVWDGVSNVVVQVVSNNGAWGSPYGQVRGHITPEIRTSLHYTDNIATSTLLATTTPTGVNSATANKRPNTVFVGTAGCMSPMIEIPVTVGPKPDFELSSYKVTSCEGGTSELVSIATNLGGYDTFVWSPTTGVSGDATTGWTFTATTDQEYTLTASQSNGICEYVKKVLVFSGVKPEANPNLATAYNVCANEIIELDVFEELPSMVAIGDGLTTTAANSEVSAFVQSEVYSKQQYIYSASELIALGVNGTGYITGLSFNTINSGASFDNANYTIKIKTTNNTSFANNNFETGAFTIVYARDVHTHTFQDWQQFTFDNPFLWDGQSNILVQITQEGTGNNANNAQTYYTDVTGMNVGLYATDELDADPATGARTSNRLDARFFFEQSTVTWSPATNLFVDAAATVPYIAGQNALTVYHTSSQAANQVYTATLTAPNNCVATESYTIDTIVAGVPVVASQQTFCGSTPVSDISVTGHQGAPLNFYNSATSTTPITTISQSGTYYVESGQGDCVSNRVAFTVSIVTLSDPTVTQFTQVVCGSGTVADLEATGNSGAQIQWFSSATSTTPLPSTQGLVNNTTYYAAQTMNGCESGRVAVLVNVNPAPAALTAQTINICGNLTYDGANLNQLGGAELVWYQSPTSQQPIPGTGQIASGTYYVSQKVNGCESPRAQIIVTAQSGTVPAPTATTQNICGSGTVADLVAQTITGGVAVWYNSSSSTTPLQPTDVLSSGTYYVAQQVGNCLSAKVPVSVRITSVTMPSVSPFNLCEGATVADLVLPTPTGTTYKWYINSTSTVPLDPADVLSSGYYFVVRDQSGCESARVQVQVTIGSRPSSPTGASPQDFVNYAEIGELIMDQTNVVWYLTYEDAMNGVNPLPANMPLVHETTYYAVIIGSNGCPSLPTAVEVTVTLGVNDFDLTQLKYYPNPTSDLLTISYNEPIVKVEVFDLNGRMIMNRDFDKETVELDFSRLSSGTYMLNIKTKDSSQFVKIVKK